MRNAFQECPGENTSAQSSSEKPATKNKNHTGAVQTPPFPEKEGAGARTMLIQAITGQSRSRSAKQTCCKLARDGGFITSFQMVKEKTREDSGVPARLWLPQQRAENNLETVTEAEHEQAHRRPHRKEQKEGIGRECPGWFVMFVSHQERIQPFGPRQLGGNSAQTWDPGIQAN